MDSRHLVDPELLPGLALMPPIDWSAEMLPQIRTMMAEQMRFDPTGGSVDMETRRIPGPQGAPEVRVVIYRPHGVAGPLPAFLHIHGGGYVVGQPEMMDERARDFAREIGCVIVSVDYRLAPETPFPGGIEDCYAALVWLHANAASLGIDPARIAIGGESAGGGLAAALALLARDRGQVPVVFQLLTYPMIDDRTVTLADAHPYAGEFIWTAGSNRFGWTALLGRAPGGDGVSPYAAAARAEKLEGLPPAFISVGALDLFLEEDIDYARRLTRAGVPTELHVYPGAYHGYELNPTARVTQIARRDTCDALKRALHPAG